ncbi:VOC family protein [uncultured Ruegeria sp.]|uniref:VOC family protein n=1 Tax=uncultured Ruegeria sp. TaxID=259304 RepID=UPI00261D6A69|nr:VOC family protein [uncultured Ruegeria sp.]
MSDIDRAINFYTKILGLKLRVKVDENWAEIDAGNGLVIGLHPASPPSTVPSGTRGAIDIELHTTRPMEEVVGALSQRGAHFAGPIKNYKNVRIAALEDPDQNTIILAEVLPSNP